MNYVLGINCSGFLSSSCLLTEQGVHTAVCEERLSRLKQDRSFPVRAIQYCLDAAGIRLVDVAAVYIGWHPRFYLSQSDNTLQDAFKQRGKLSYLALNELAALAHEDLTDVTQQLLFADDSIDIRFVDHHRAHLANAFYQSGFEAADFLMLDGFGEVSTGLAGAVSTSGVVDRHAFGTPHSLGSFYSAFTDFCGFRPNIDEWKVMALSALGDPDRYYDAVRRLIHVDGLQLELDLTYFEHFLFFTPRYFTPKLVDTFGEPLEAGAEPTQRHCDVVAAVQKVAEEVVFALLDALHRESRQTKLVVGGGFFMNSVCNGKLLAGTPYEDVFIGGSPDDSGVSIGSAYYGAAQLGWDLPRQRACHNYFGRDYGADAARHELERRKIAFRTLDDPPRIAAGLLAANKIVGWYHGPSEFGQRALGNRSILANPTDPQAKATVNATVKYREAFRPFAPAVLAKSQAALFTELGDQDAYFMEKVFRFTPHWAKRLPAVSHFDGSGRLQTVDEGVNPRFAALIAEFEKLTGAPAVLNTSFNTSGMPLVETPGDAINCFFDSGIDALVLDRFLVEK